MKPKLQFWYEYGSPYSYLTAMRIDPLARAAGVEIDWRVFLLGPVFRAAGWESSPFLQQPVKFRYMWRDVARIAASRGLEFAKPPVFPANGLYAARIALIADREGWIEDWNNRVYQAEFVRGMDIARETVLATLCAETGRDGEAVFAAAQEQPIKDHLRTRTEEALSLEIFGAPTFITPSGELFWGDDRLEAALATTVED